MNTPNPKSIDLCFAFNSSALRIVGTLDEPLFVAADVCKLMEIQNPTQALLSVPEAEKGLCKTYTPGGSQEMLVLKEPGLYRVIMRSNKPEAEAFQDWVFREVLPSIRRTGRYELLHNYSEEFKELWAEARGTSAQVALCHLEAARMGLALPGKPAKAETLPTLTPVDAETFWWDVTQLLEEGKLDRTPFVAEDGPAGAFLYFYPEPVLAALGQSQSRYRAHRMSVRDMVSGFPGWIPAKTSKYVAGLGKSCTVWGFKVDVALEGPLLRLWENIQRGEA